jgi:hypothetical protein
MLPCAKAKKIRWLAAHSIKINKPLNPKSLVNSPLLLQRYGQKLLLILFPHFFAFLYLSSPLCAVGYQLKDFEYQ